MSEQIHMHYTCTRHADTPPAEIVCAIDAYGQVTQLYLRPEQDDSAWWDRKYPSCAPHRIITMREVLP